MSAPLSADVPPGRHDAAVWRQAARKGRERGCSIYISAEELAAAGIDPYGEPPRFKVWPGRKRSLMIALQPKPPRAADDGG